ncbi:MAG: hypothetical protein KDN20_24610 [Verrucomicrobiae bacterium]|nr:hypothetical protein [Verrucomicrobiae bacterium]
MNKLNPYFRNPFFTPAISINQYAAGTTDHLGRLTENPHPKLNPLIAPTSTALANFEEAITDNAAKGALRKMRKRIKDNFRATISAQVDLIMGGVRRALAQNNRPPEEELQYLPGGLSPFTRLPDDGMDNELERFAGVLADRPFAKNDCRNPKN